MSVEAGQKLQGKVTGITNFGAFIDLGKGKSGLVHISQVSNNFIENVNEVLNVGDEVKVKVLSISDAGKISLSIKQAEEVPTKKQLPAKEKREPRKFERSREKKNVSKQNFDNKQDFDSLMNSFLKTSDERLASLRRNTEGKRGGRGGRRG
ncbi:S1 RNA binding domain protein [Pilibacter termitis]|uniref:S1 RNA binding domain protein n=1 Tax=Pilibacter termitis TaxID=263852 RepID=A0A1T4MD28_9ENTE|nr:S1 domain-containing RNA-binding protein [Pilibacter termitis]SJZ64644.1 S1 RNA binding domain protein [Pilibacter termitis]